MCFDELLALICAGKIQMAFAYEPAVEKVGLYRRYPDGFSPEMDQEILAAIMANLGALYLLIHSNDVRVCIDQARHAALYTESCRLGEEYRCCPACAMLRDALVAEENLP